MIDYMRATSGETDYMVRYPEEISMTIEEEQELIERVEVSDDLFSAAVKKDEKSRIDRTEGGPIYCKKGVF